MSTTTALTASDVRRDGERALAVALGLARRTPPPVRLPSFAQQIVPGRSPLEASGWAEPAVRRVATQR
ncbi:hypothetical protein [Cellulomonas dongxiuzhuiae]|uniref:Uncharacterized protein n=1 Tax=Cellulomonas dongxiuzhuiae TaxID=2819979 RepID=A0ABX8GH29_9CELL|nr:hypothetical protein [Cellulomonas dongxiuzhuiae]MBO3088234.1 hypothetical protein [Cellulomonas dongxiuzhuiae]MBO3094419.1 hypothetical protein [Cellulomonas dongxiuzhuiae]QWC15447.1 hypothetical protein KKR89_14250 [Cellulomonas dongxiuzhuiae]